MKKELWLLAIMAAVLAEQAYFSTEDAYKYVNPFWLFWIKAGLVAIGAGAAAIKGFMSTTYSDWKHRNGKTEKDE